MANVLAGKRQNLLWLEELFTDFLTCDIQLTVTLSVKWLQKLKFTI